MEYPSCQKIHFKCCQHCQRVQVTNNYMYLYDDHGVKLKKYISEKYHETSEFECLIGFLC